MNTLLYFPHVEMATKCVGIITEQYVPKSGTCFRSDLMAGP